MWRRRYRPQATLRATNDVGLHARMSWPEPAVRTMRAPLCIGILVKRVRSDVHLPRHEPFERGAAWSGHYGAETRKRSVCQRTAGACRDPCRGVGRRACPVRDRGCRRRLQPVLGGPPLACRRGTCARHRGANGRRPVRDIAAACRPFWLAARDRRCDLGPHGVGRVGRQPALQRRPRVRLDRRADAHLSRAGVPVGPVADKDRQGALQHRRAAVSPCFTCPRRSSSTSSPCLPLGRVARPAVLRTPSC